MKRCPSCGYDNPDSGSKCNICSSEISAVIPWYPPPQSRKGPGLMILAGVIFILCGAVFFFSRGPGGKSAPAVQAADDQAYNYAGTYYALDKMKALHFLPRGDKLKTLGLISCPDARVARAAARLAGQWAGEEGATDDGRLFFGTLLTTALSGGTASAEAAVQAALLIARGFPCQQYIPEIRKAAAGLVASPDKDFRAAGFLLAAMAGMRDFDAEMVKTFREDPSPDAKLYAACAMARRGNRDGYGHLTALASGSDTDMKLEALACLAYSSVPGTDAFLSAEARGSDPAAAGMAKSVVMSRKQLAIINR